MRSAYSRGLWLVSQLTLGLILLSTLPPAWAQQGRFTIGQQVEVAGTGTAINLRDAPGLSSNVITTLPNGTVMTVVGGPQSANGYVWWEIEGKPGRGWAEESLLRPASGSALPTNISAEAGCEVSRKTYGGIYYCQRAGGIHVVVIDLNDPHIRFETVLAYDVDTVQSPKQEWIHQMVNRYPGVVAAINADYFGENHHGPEGLTIKNGFRFDSLRTMERSALVIGKSPLDEAGGSLPIHAEVIRLEKADGPLDPTVYYNAVSGGPQVVFTSSWDWARGHSHPRYSDCRQNPPPDDVINGECFLNTKEWDQDDKSWTAVGITGDQKMIWVIAPYQHISTTLTAFSVQTAIKLDGGGSSQLWYDQQRVVWGRRPVADALFVFYMRSARVVEQPEWPVIAQKGPLAIRVTLENTGAETWTVGGYALVNEENSWGSETRLPLPRDVKPGETVTLEWTTEPFSQWGIFKSKWRLAQGDAYFPDDPVEITVIVIPEFLDTILQWIQWAIAHLRNLLILIIAVLTFPVWFPIVVAIIRTILREVER